jgi:hypothetical protein
MRRDLSTRARGVLSQFQQMERDSNRLLGECQDLREGIESAQESIKRTWTDIDQAVDESGQVLRTNREEHERVLKEREVFQATEAARLPDAGNPDLVIGHLAITPSLSEILPTHRESRAGEIFAQVRDKNDIPVGDVEPTVPYYEEEWWKKESEKSGFVLTEDVFSEEKLKSAGIPSTVLPEKEAAKLRKQKEGEQVLNRSKLQNGDEK